MSFLEERCLSGGPARCIASVGYQKKGHLLERGGLSVWASGQSNAVLDLEEKSLISLAGGKGLSRRRKGLARGGQRSSSRR